MAKTPTEKGRAFNDALFSTLEGSNTVTCLRFKSIHSQTKHFGSIGLLPIRSKSVTDRAQAIIEHARSNTPPERKTPRLDSQAGCYTFEA